jgi:hypothetical protein
MAMAAGSKNPADLARTSYSDVDKYLSGMTGYSGNIIKS